MRAVFLAAWSTARPLRLERSQQGRIAYDTDEERPVATLPLLWQLLLYLNQAKMLGEVLIVAVNSDASVTRLKGPHRPIMPLHERLQALAALSCIDHLIAFDADTPEALIRLVRPDIFVKGGTTSAEGNACATAGVRPFSPLFSRAPAAARGA